MDYAEESLKLHKEKKGKIEVVSKVKIENKDDLAIAYTPGVAEPCLKIADDKNKVYDYTAKQNMIAVVTDGSAVLGLGNLGPEASLPVMEGKCILFKNFADVDAFPIALATQNVGEIIKAIKLISPGFGGINLEDISAPRCFEIEESLKRELDIPVFHDDQHGTAVVILAGLINALKLAGKSMKDVKIVVNGAGAAAIATVKLLIKAGAEQIILIDSKGVIYDGREEGMNPYKEEIAKLTNPNKEKGQIHDVIRGKDIFIGVSKGNLLKTKDIQNMNDKPIIFAMANPIPEINPDDAKKAGAFIVATGRSDYPNQVNNVLAFPGIFRGTLDARATTINDEMKYAAARILTDCVTKLSTDNIIPSALDKSVAAKVAEAVKKTAIKTGVAGFVYKSN